MYLTQLRSCLVLFGFFCVCVGFWGFFVVVFSFVLLCVVVFLAKFMCSFVCWFLSVIICVESSLLLLHLNCFIIFFLFTLSFTNCFKKPVAFFDNA